MNKKVNGASGTRLHHQSHPRRVWWRHDNVKLHRGLRKPHFVLSGRSVALQSTVYFT